MDRERLIESSLKVCGAAAVGSLVGCVGSVGVAAAAGFFGAASLVPVITHGMGKEAISGAMAVVHGVVGEFVSHDLHESRERLAASGDQHVAKALLEALNDTVVYVRNHPHDFKLAMHEEMVLESTSRYIGKSLSNKKSIAGFATRIEDAFQAHFGKGDAGAATRLAVEAVLAADKAREVLTIAVRAMLMEALERDWMYKGSNDPGRLPDLIIKRYADELGPAVMSMMMTDSQIREKIQAVATEIQVRAQRQGVEELRALNGHLEVFLSTRLLSPGSLEKLEKETRAIQEQIDALHGDVAAIGALLVQTYESLYRVEAGVERIGEDVKELRSDMSTLLSLQSDGRGLLKEILSLLIAQNHSQRAPIVEVNIERR